MFYSNIKKREASQRGFKMNELKVSFEYIKEHCETIGDLKKLCSNVKNLKELKGGVKKWTTNKI